MVCISWKYLFGRVIATDYANRKKVEWPPHPDRVFQALIAAWGERGEDEKEKAALKWIEEQDLPELVIPKVLDHPESVSVFVPSNDIEASKGEIKKDQYGDKKISILPGLRKRSERFFPSLHVGQQECHLVWSKTIPEDLVIPLTNICKAVQRIGHSSSFVSCRFSQTSPDVGNEHVRFKPVLEKSKRLGIPLRIPGKGRLDTLWKNHHAALKKTIPQYQAPPLANQKLFIKKMEEPIEVSGDFSSDILVFRSIGNKKVNLIRTHHIINALRSSFMPWAEKEGEDVLRLFSGHETSGEPIREPHIAFIPLPFVDARYADGHILGLGVLFPVKADQELRESALQAIANALDEDLKIKLTLGRMGVFEIQYDGGMLKQKALRVDTWVRASCYWDSVTPFVLDRMARKKKDLEEWTMNQVFEACKYQGIPEPETVKVSAIPFVEGCPTCFEYPHIKRNDGTKRWMSHISISFRNAVSGPLVLGAGRYKGYGLFRPVKPYNERCRNHG